jgi:hypothetical protein
MYRKVNIFNWYQPKHQLFGRSSPYEYSETEWSFWRNLGHINKFKKFQGYRPFKLSDKITPSTMVQQPVAIELLNLSSTI